MYILIFIAILAACFWLSYTIRKKSHTTQPNGSDSADNQSNNNEQLQLLDLNATTLSERQRYYRRGYHKQMQYDEVQRRAEASGDTAILESLRLRTYAGPLPTLEEEPQTTSTSKSATRPSQSRPTIDNPKVQRLRYFCVKDKGYHVSVWPKDQGIGDYLEFPIAGITHGEHIDDHLGEFAATLQPDPLNPYDPQAIKIITREGHRVGYVPRDQTQYVRDFTSLPCKCYCYIGINDGIYFTDCYITRNS